MKRVTPYLLSASAYIGGLGLTITSAWLITTASFQPPILVLSVAIVGVRFFGIFRSVARYFERISSHKTVFDQLTKVRVRLYEAVASHPRELLRDISSGTLVKRIVDDVERAQEYQLRVTLPGVAAVISVAVGIALGGWIKLESILITLPLSILLLFLFPHLIKSECESTARKIELSESQYAKLLEQSAHGMAEATLYGYLDERLEQTGQIENAIWQQENSLLTLSRRYQFLVGAVSGAALVGLALLALKNEYRIPPVQVTMLIFLPLVMFEAVAPWYPNLFAAGKLLLARSEIVGIERGRIAKVPNLSTLPSPITTMEGVNIQARWEIDQEFMKPVSFHVTTGECLVIRGRSGAGKTTLAMALLGLLEYEGEILFNGVELRNISDLSDHVSGAIQDGHIFNTTLRENLKIAAPAATDAQLVAALEIVELDSLLSELEASLDTVIGQMGRTLSGGEIKRINLARAILSPAEILVLDEPTEHLDRELASRIEARLTDLGRILIVITHSGWSMSANKIQLTR